MLRRQRAILAFRLVLGQSNLNRPSSCPRPPNEPETHRWSCRDRAQCINRYQIWLDLRCSRCRFFFWGGGDAVPTWENLSINCFPCEQIRTVLFDSHTPGATGLALVRAIGSTCRPRPVTPGRQPGRPITVPEWRAGVHVYSITKLITALKIQLARPHCSAFIGLSLWILESLYSQAPGNEALGALDSCNAYLNGLRGIQLIEYNASSTGGVELAHWTKPNCTGFSTSYTSTVNTCFNGYVRSRAVFPPTTAATTAIDIRPPGSCVYAARLLPSSPRHAVCLCRALEARHCIYICPGFKPPAPPPNATAPPLARVPTPPQSTVYWKVTAEGSGGNGAAASGSGGYVALALATLTAAMLH